MLTGFVINWWKSQSWYTGTDDDMFHAMKHIRFYPTAYGLHWSEVTLIGPLHGHDESIPAMRKATYRQYRKVHNRVEGAIGDAMTSLASQGDRAKTVLLPMHLYYFIASDRVFGLSVLKTEGEALVQSSDHSRSVRVDDVITPLDLNQALAF